jgi:uncharacterized protein
MRLERDLSPLLYYHSLWHTRDEVASRSEWLAEQEGLSNEARVLVGTAAYYHDIGLTCQYVDHEAVSVQIASAVLPGFGYLPQQIEIITSIISATRIPQSARGILQKVVADADLDVLGRADFFARNRALRAEMSALGSPLPDEIWYPQQLRFLEQHHYFTKTARRQRIAKKQENLRAMREIVTNCCPHSLETVVTSPSPV